MTEQTTESTASSDRDGRPTIYELLAKVMTEVHAVGKDDKMMVDGKLRYSFRGVDAVVNAAGPAFRKHGVIPVPQLRTIAARDAGGKARETTVEVEYRFYGPGGDHVAAIVPGEGLDYSDKGTAKAMSVAYRIALLQVLCIPTDDPETTIERGAPARRQATKAEPDDVARDAFFAAIPSIETKDDIKKAWKQSADGARAGKWTAKDAERMQQELTKRSGQLTTPSASAPVAETAQRASAQRRPAPSADQPVHDEAGWPEVAPVPNGRPS